MLTSVVIPIRDAADQLLYTLFSLNLQFTAFEEFEVIVLDNASCDGVAERVERFDAHYPVRVIRFRRRMPYYHLINAGIARASGDLVILLSCNMMVPREFIGVHRHAHELSDKLVLLGLGTTRIYSVYEPDFSPIQQQECREWLELYPHIKRPHTMHSTVPLLEESQIVSGQLFHIGLPCPEAEKRQAIRQKYGPRLEQHRSPWTLFQTQHVSVLRENLLRAGGCKELPKLEMERDLAKRLLRKGCQFQFADKLTLIKQERAIRKVRAQSVSKKNRRAQ
ncbi:glycosyltransferase family 2 protein [Brevibacillus choshinensis]|uniref:Glycosyltransferase family 2 protein n=1 Tax=Brevibacillus choshinensis TaxID=54911 RepID=A0ABX7FQM1_BRECH|nr:glycosyltransferase family A protein [Brevibacillus choshinensis]QRG68396.1 glycosyltransferase family 2 protein [Brevibacillus choshinensis]